MAEVYMVENLKPEAMKKLAVNRQALFETYRKDRYQAEMQWLRNLRQFKGVHDPEIEKLIPADQSKAYPKLTRQKVVGTCARLMEMLFPQTDKNYSVTNSPLPTLSEPDLQKVLDQLVTEKGPDLTDALIEEGILSLAKVKAERLELEVDDQLKELDYVQIAKRLVFSAVLYGIGILRGPMMTHQPGRAWTRNAEGKWVASTVQKKKPVFETVPVWDWYTDMSAKSLDKTDAEFQRRITTRTQLHEWAKDPGFLGDQIEAYLKENRVGNYKELHWETALREKGDKNNTTDLSGRKYEVIEFWGRITGEELKSCGVNVAEEDLGKEVEANLWMLGGTIIKAAMNPYDGRIRGYHTFVYEEDETNLLGNGLPQVMRDSQLAVVEAARMILDNASVVCGPMLEVNHQKLVPGQDLDIYSRKVWVREDDGMDSQTPAVREINVNSHINELIQVIDLFMGFADAETALPPPALGDVSGQGKESLRTTGNLSMLLGAAALPIRDTVRNFDRFTTSFITSLCHWNIEFNPNPALDGDFAVIARGSTSLIAKEVRATSLDQFVMTLDPQDKMYLSRKKVLVERMKVRDLPLDLLEDDNVVKDLLAEEAKNAAATAAQQTRHLDAEIRGLMAGAFKDLMNGLKAQAGANADTFNTLVEGITNVRSAELEASQAGTRDAPAAPRKRTERAGVSGAS